MKHLSLLLIGAAVVGCAVQPAPVAAPQPGPRLSEAIAGRVAGTPRSCLPYYRSGDMVVLDGNALVFRDGPRIWVSRVNPGCSRLASGNYALVTRSLGGIGLCSGDIAQVVDPSSGIFAGSCVIGEFVPYARP